jgi:hypothetical protein
MFASLVSCCSIDCFDIWKDTALLDVAELQLGKIDCSGVPLVEDHDMKLTCCAMNLPSVVTKAAQNMQLELRRICYVAAAAYSGFMKTFSVRLTKSLKKLNND